MSLISHAHFDLVRIRKNMEGAIQNSDWAGLKSADKAMGQALDAAFDDSARNPQELVSEMERILAMYAQIVAELPSAAAKELARFPHSVG